MTVLFEKKSLIVNHEQNWKLEIAIFRIKSKTTIKTIKTNQENKKHTLFHQADPSHAFDSSKSYRKQITCDHIFQNGVNFEFL